MFPEIKIFRNVKKPLNVRWTHQKTTGNILRITAFFFFVGMFSGTAFAHPPKSVTLTYEAATQMLKATIIHPSFAPNWHYIKSVVIEKNNKPVDSYTYKSQPGDEFAYTYEIPAVPGDIFVVNVYCSFYGSRTESLTIPLVPKP